MTRVTVTNEAGETMTRETVEEVAETTSTPTTSKRARGLKPGDVSEMIVQHNIKTYTELLDLAQERKENGETDLSNYILDKGPTKATEIMTTTWEMKEARDELRRQKMSRLEILNEVSPECVDGCDGQWFDMAIETITQNRINPVVLAKAIWDLLESGRKKHLNLMLVGPTNCGKTFLLQPLHEIFRVFATPANNRFAWTNIDKAEVIYLNDFRWNEEVIPFDSLLRLLEGMLFT